jgi:hypothetical protein
MEFNELLSRFADRYAVEGIDATDGVAVLSVDGTEVTFREDAAGGAVVLAAEIGEMPPDASGVFASVALRANFIAFGGTALSLDAETDELAVSTSLPLALADPDALSAAVEALVNTAEEWRRNAVAFLDVDEESALLGDEDAAANPLSGDSGFLRV